MEILSLLCVIGFFVGIYALTSYSDNELWATVDKNLDNKFQYCKHKELEKRFFNWFSRRKTCKKCESII